MLSPISIPPFLKALPSYSDFLYLIPLFKNENRTKKVPNNNSIGKLYRSLGVNLFI
ncbi:hypothetical protein HMPREF9372_3134 [Sporosarcina newyorkensis 2681]|uniref:Uncharacterized protein n=1 Tax=Sporosarcina newyorkensis 2681 TaxID=1027292 RepID=F9DWF3_9BACL|nr:hypothetical protein HMPREF9372_3134 [Sporosarcina newyorkensis 2681]